MGSIYHLGQGGGGGEGGGRGEIHVKSSRTGEVHYIVMNRTEETSVNLLYTVNPFRPASVNPSCYS